MVKNDLFAGKEITEICSVPGTVEQVEQGGTNHEPLIIAHRGASAHTPENTLSALQMAVDAGADGVEFDVRLAKDGVPVVIHDETLARTAFRSEKTSDLTADELNKIDVGSWFNTKYPGRSKPSFARETIPTLAQAMQLLHAFRGLIYIELKAGDYDCCELSEAVCNVICESPLRPQIILKSFNLALIPEIKHRLAEVQTAALFEPTIMSYLRRRDHLVSMAREIGADQISVHRALVTRKLASLASESQTPVTIWTIDDPAWLTRSRELGIKALITNDPAKMLNARRFHF